MGGGGLLCTHVFACSLLSISVLATLRGAYSFMCFYDNQFTILLASGGRMSWLTCELCYFVKLPTYLYNKTSPDYYGPYGICKQRIL